MTTRQRLLFVNGIVLALFAVPSFFMDIRAIFLGAGPLTSLLRGMPAAGIGFLEAHGLAAILAFCFLAAGRKQAVPGRGWHITAAATHALLGIANIALWQIFVIVDNLPLGYVSTGVHFVFATLQLIAAFTSTRAAAGALRY